ncbi:MAG: hypothetical protein ACK52I_29505 [Pseudomonadota bacterium]
MPRESDVFRERLYCIRWQTGEDGRVYAAPTKSDLEREEKAFKLLKKRFKDWQEQGFIPSMKIESGYNTDQVIRERGWTHWHHLFNPRQLLVAGLVNSVSQQISDDSETACVTTLLLGKIVNRNARLSRWDQGSSKGQETFTDQALNPMYNYVSRGWIGAYSLELEPGSSTIQYRGEINTLDARSITQPCDLWVTDPPYADAVNYHELTEYFLAFYQPGLKNRFSKWSKESRRALAVKGSDQPFMQSMIDCYKNMTTHLADDGYQVVMFTHQDASVWADLSTILWASGLQVVSAWCIATEADSAMREGNYVKGTVFLLLRKRNSLETAFLDELFPAVEDEVKKQVEQLINLDDTSDPNFGDSDIQLAAYAAALRVLTSYASIEDIDIESEIKRKDKNNSPITKIIESAVKIASEYLVPRGIDLSVWKKLTPTERLYLKGLDVETRGENRDSVYQELARGFGVPEYRELLASSKANHVRLRTPNEFARKELDTPGFGSSLTRKIIFSIYEAKKSDGVIHGKNYLREEVSDYWSQKKLIVQILDYLCSMRLKLTHWKEDGDLARLLKGAIENDHV